MSWIGLVMAALGVLQSLTKFFGDRQIIKANEATHATEVLTAARNRSDELTKAMDAAAGAATPGKLPDGQQQADPFQRD